MITTPPLMADLVARVEAGGRRSDEVRVSPRLAAFLGAFSVVAHYPSYLGLDAEALPIGGDTLVLPEGTRLAVSGRATTPLGTVKLQGPGSDVALTVEGAAFHGELIPRSTGVWHLAAAPANGGVLEGEAPLLPIRIVPDSVPAVEIALPVLTRLRHHQCHSLWWCRCAMTMVSPRHGWIPGAAVSPRVFRWSCRPGWVTAP